MNLRNATRIAVAAISVAIVPAIAQQPPAQLTVDLKPLGVASDLFSDQSDSKYGMRGLIQVFWLDNDHFAAAFSTTRRWSSTQKPEPLGIRLIVFDLQGKELHRRDWELGADGAENSMTLELTPGPDNSILAIHQPNSEGKIPDGDFVQVLNADTTPRQDFYIPATSNWIPSITTEPVLALQSYFANKRSSVTWWSSKPLKAGVKVDLPSGQEAVLAGPPGIAARADCTNPDICFAVRVYRSEKSTWIFTLPEAEEAALPRVFLNPTSLVIELRRANQKQSELVVSRADGTHASLPALPRGSQVIGFTGVSRDGQRFALTAVGEVGICGMFDVWCNERGRAFVFDVPANKIIFQQGISPAGGTSSLSPDGKRLAILDRGKISVYPLP